MHVTAHKSRAAARKRARPAGRAMRRDRPAHSAHVRRHGGRAAAGCARSRKLAAQSLRPQALRGLGTCAEHVLKPRNACGRAKLSFGAFLQASQHAAKLAPAAASAAAAAAAPAAAAAAGLAPEEAPLRLLLRRGCGLRARARVHPTTPGPWPPRAQRPTSGRRVRPRSHIYLVRDAVFETHAPARVRVHARARWK